MHDGARLGLHLGEEGGLVRRLAHRAVAARRPCRALTRRTLQPRQTRGTQSLNLVLVGPLVQLVQLRVQLLLGALQRREQSRAEHVADCLAAAAAATASAHCETPEE